MKILNNFEYRRPDTLTEALGILAEHGAKASPLAGGTDLVVNMKYRSMLQLVDGAGTDVARFEAARRVPPMARPEIVVSLNRLSGLTGTRREKDMFWLGPLTTMADVVDSELLPPALEALRDAAGVVGSPILRNTATVGGNLCNARPAADTAVALLALGARLELKSAAVERVLEIDGFFTGPGKTVKGEDELLVGIELDCDSDAGSAYLRHGTRRQLEIAMTSAAVWVKIDAGSSKITGARVALGAVGPTPVLAPGAAGLLVGSTPEPGVVAAAAAKARDEIRPIDDFRGSADYRLELAETLTERAISLAVERARSEGGAS